MTSSLSQPTQSPRSLAKQLETLPSFAFFRPASPHDSSGASSTRNSSPRLQTTGHPQTFLRRRFCDKGEVVGILRGLEQALAARGGYKSRGRIAKPDGRLSAWTPKLEEDEQEIMQSIVQCDPYMAQVVGKMQRDGVPALPPPSYSLLNAQFQPMAANEVRRSLPNLLSSEVTAIVRKAWSRPIESCPQQQASRPAAESQYVASLLRLRDSCLDKPPAEIREPLHLGPWPHKLPSDLVGCLDRPAGVCLWQGQADHPRAGAVRVPVRPTQQDVAVASDDVVTKDLEAMYRMTNVVAASQRLDGVYWAKIEEYIRSLSYDFLDVYVATMPIFRPTTPDNEYHGHHYVPRTAGGLTVPTMALDYSFR
ncbi:hypothetical protein FA10DRAFT_279827 [Acaromyces ingoldii]|uniref:DNA/RNA non-specific endonuclease/pyrophosphatase/phosphodiesterase domain-containing protein n=1 Tax=Acaromyces ingoldii TaxID=215250 RepID=A0A316YN52_9BASI|nr:hypothetical protein FA10DRAFT_279827 [Acaromyces ingoldii]PWN90797.1 hypothetical protein FA10DRAFT_279827 [Acaromyces ingoldii]